MIEIACPRCHRTLRLPNQYGGAELNCTNCGQSFVTPTRHSIHNDQRGAPENSRQSLTGSSVSPEPLTAEYVLGATESLRTMAGAEQAIAEARFKQRQAQKVASWCMVIITTSVLLFLVVKALKSRMIPDSDFDATRTYDGEVIRRDGELLPSIEGSDDALPLAPLPPTREVFSDVKYYHVNRLCPSLKSVPTVSTLALALPRGKQPCAMCAPGQPYNPTPLPPAAAEIRQGHVSVSEKPAKDVDQKLVFVGQIGEKYHRENCEALHGLVRSMNLSSAQLKGLTACAVCKPPR